MKLQKADFHIHTSYSDGQSSPEKVLEYIDKKTDLTVIAITDHNTIDGALKAIEINKIKKYKFKIIIGEEISTKEGHVIGLFLKKKIKSGMSAHDTLLEIKKQNGITLASHPFYETKVLENGNLISGIGLKLIQKENKLIDSLEVYNGNLIMYFSENKKAKKINEMIFRKPEIGSSDAHIISGIGKCYTLLFANNLSDIKKSIILGETIAKSENWDLTGAINYTIYIAPSVLSFLFLNLKLILYEIYKKIFNYFSNRTFSQSDGTRTDL